MSAILPRKKKIDRAVRLTAPYSALAPIYDYVMGHVDYDHWARYLLSLFKQHGDRVEHVLDVSCGTGSLCRHLADAGLTVYGCDAAWPMLRVARKKVGAQRFWCGDLRSLGANWAPQAVLSTYDSMNYLMTQADWLAALRSIHQLLPLGGIFIFDISTLYNSTTVFQRYTQKDTTPGGNYLRTSYFQPRGSIQVNEFKIRLAETPKVLFKEVHRQKILPLDTVRGYIAETPFQLQACYSDFTFLPANEKAERVHFVVKKVVAPAPHSHGSAAGVRRG
ncbi:class I SAM-dependent methyltransferase [bacterium]|nr:class I SAM-dependent methyltransferase [bacterium]